MRPMSLFETGHATGAIAVGTLLDGGPPRSPATEHTVRHVAEWVAVGGWPGHLDRGLTPTEAWQANRDYLEEIRRVDVPRVDSARRDPEKIGRLLRSRPDVRPGQRRDHGADAGGTDTR